VSCKVANGLGMTPKTGAQAKHGQRSAGSFVFKACQPAHSRLCNRWHKAEDGRKDKQAGLSFDRNRLSLDFLENQRRAQG
jgi:hypothetical protein